MEGARDIRGFPEGVALVVGGQNLERLQKGVAVVVFGQIHTSILVEKVLSFIKLVLFIQFF